MGRVNWPASKRYPNMITRAKSDARRFLEGLRGSPLTFGRMTASVRVADGIPQADLARRLGISRANLCDIEKGRRSVTAKRAAQFARILGYSVNQFVAAAVEDHLRKAGLEVPVRLEAFWRGGAAGKVGPVRFSADPAGLAP